MMRLSFHSSDSASSIRSALLRVLILAPRSRTHATQGLTLIECLVAIIIIALTVVAITPPIMLATGTRIQSRRADQANQIAQGEIDRIRTLVERRKNDPNLLPAAIGSNDIKSAPAPTTFSSLLLSPANCGTYPPAAPAPTPANPNPPAPAPPAVTSLIPVDVNGDCKPDYSMQVFRTAEPIPDPSEKVPFAFVMGVRVYTYNSAGYTYETTRASLVGTTGRRDRGANNTSRPLAVLYSTVARNDSSKSLTEICKQAGDASKCKF